MFVIEGEVVLCEDQSNQFYNVFSGRFLDASCIQQFPASQNFYQRLDEDPTEQCAEEVTSLLCNMMNKPVISKEIFYYLRPQKPRTSQFYILSKIHKDEISGRPIVSSCGVPTEKIPSLLILFSNNWSQKCPHLLKIPQTSY